MSRRQFLVGSSGALLAGGLAATLPGTRAFASALRAPLLDAGSTTKINVQFSWTKSVEFSGYYLADSDGYFSANGIDVNLLGGGPNSPAPEQAIAGGSAQLATSTSLETVTTAIKAGTDLVVLGAVYQKSMGAIISPANKPIKSLKDLVGKKLGIDYASDKTLYENLLKSQGIEGSIDYVSIGSDPAPLAEGQVDAIEGFINDEPLTLASRGFKTYSLPSGDYGLQSYTDHIIVSRSYLKANRAVVVNYLKALVKGYQLNMKGPAPAAKLTVDVYGKGLGFDVAKQTKENAIFIEAQTSDLTKKHGIFWIDTNFIAGPVYKGLAQYGLKDLPDPKSYVDLSVLQDVYKNGTNLL